MIITVSKSTIVGPAQQTHQGNIWISNLDQMTVARHTPTVYFYKSNGTPDFFRAEILKEALSKTLVHFYPMAGRLKRTEGGRIEIDCNSKGALFVEATSDSIIDDFGDFDPKPELEQLIPMVNYTDHISTHPPLLLQITRFKCGGVCLGFGIHHTIADGASALHFIKAFCAMARGLKLTVLPYFDHSPLRARYPPSPAFEHIEYQSKPSIETLKTNHPSSLKESIFKLSGDQLNKLKAIVNAKECGNNMLSYTTLEILASHLWRCVCKARGLKDDEESWLYIPTDGRSRLRPPLSPGYFGNVIFIATAMSFAGDLRSKPLHYLAGKIHDAIVRMDDEYLRSALDFLEVQPDLSDVVHGDKILRSPHMSITSWHRLPLYDADFGWGKPFYMGPAGVYYEGKVYVLANPVDDGSLSLAISLQTDHMLLFSKLLYDFEWLEK